MAIEIKHTPQPWKHDHGMIMGPEQREDRPKTGDVFRLADVRGWGHLQYLPGDKGEEMQDANGRLIAAAPEMFEALKGLLSFFDDMPENGPESEFHPHNAIRASKAILARVDGKPVPKR